MRVVYSSAARDDLAAIGDFIAQDSPARAASFTLQPVEACGAIAELPLGSPVMPRYARYGYRRKVHGSYLIVYRALADQIQVVRIIHGRRDVDRVLSRGDP